MNIRIDFYGYKWKAFDADPKIKKQTNFIENPDCDESVPVISVFEESMEASLDFPSNSQKVS